MPNFSQQRCRYPHSIANVLNKFSVTLDVETCCNLTVKALRFLRNVVDVVLRRTPRFALAENYHFVYFTYPRPKRVLRIDKQVEE